MSKPTKSAAPGKGGSSMLTGVLVGMVVGVALAAGLAWFIMKSPSPFVNKEQSAKAETAQKPVAEAAKSVAEAPHPKIEAASGVDEAKPRFEFYKVLTDKPEAAPAPADSASKPADKVKEADKSTVAGKMTDTVSDVKKPAQMKANYLQAGSFANASDAENLKASLAMKGMEASVQDVTIPGKGVWHRVRVGPFTSEKEMDTVRGTLKLNGMDVTPTH